MKDDRLHIFISYGHYDADWEIVKRIIDFLERSSHCTVWLDKKDIEEGSDWRRKIVDGIHESNPIIGLISAYSTRDKSVCLDELAISVCSPEKRLITILLDPEKQVRIPSSVSRIQWLDMSDWKKYRDMGAEEFDKWFSGKMMIVENIIENEDLNEFQGEINFLKQILAADYSDSKYRNFLDKEYTRREWAEDCFDEFVRSDGKRFFSVRGGPGFGKSHFIARQMHWNERVVAGYFIEWNKKVPVNNMIRSIAFQIATRLPDYRANLINHLFAGIDRQNYSAVAAKRSELDKMSPAELIDFLIVNQMPKINGGINNYVIVIDGLDEAYHDGENAFADVLASDIMGRLPKWIKIVYTYRSEPELGVRLQRFEKETQVLDFYSTESERDIAAYLKEQLKEFIDSGRIDEKRIEAIARRCEKTFIYAEYLCDCFKKGIIDITSPLERIPANISGIYYSYFKRLFAESSYEDFREPLGVIVANGGEIGVDQLRFVMNWSRPEFRRFYEQMRSFIVVYTEANDPIVRFYHKTINEWLTDKEISGDFAVDAERSTAAILSACRACCLPEKYADQPYRIRKYSYQKLIEHGNAADKSRMNSDFAFMQSLQEEAYHTSDFAFANKMFETIRYCYGIASAQVKAADRAIFARANIMHSEAKIADEKGVIEEFLKIEEEFADVLEADAELYAMTEDNICYLMRTERPAEAEERIEKLEAFIEPKDYEKKWYTIPQIYYHHGLILYVKGNRSNDRKEAEACYREAVERLEFAINGAEISYPPEMAKDLIFKAQNPLARCCSMLGDHEKACKIARDSLKLRLERYGEFSHYTALGYDILARSENDRAKVNREPVSDSTYECARKALDIDTYIFGSRSAATARNLQTFAILYKEDDRGDIARLRLARRYAEDALKVFEANANVGDSAIGFTRKLLADIEEKIKTLE